MKAAEYGIATKGASALVSTNSICQGQQVPILWPLIFKTGHQIAFAHTSFKWANLAAHNAGVTVVIVGIATNTGKSRRLFAIEEQGIAIERHVSNINPYLVPAENVFIEPTSRSANPQLAQMQFGNHPYYGAALIFSEAEKEAIILRAPEASRFIRPLYGSKEFISSAPRACLWIKDEHAKEAAAIAPIAEKLEAVTQARKDAKQDKAAQKLAEMPHRFRDQVTADAHVIVVPRVSSETREFLPAGILTGEAIIQDQAFALYDAPLWNMALIASRLHLVWIATVCGKLKTDFRYSNTLGWNTFPVPPLTDKNKADLTRCAEDILLAREAHFPATIAELYDPDEMPANLREAHERNDETLERIYIGRRFKNDTERLEKLFERYTKMTAGEGRTKSAPGTKAKRKRRTSAVPSLVPADGD
jgi:hypothetical protein